MYKANNIVTVYEDELHRQYEENFSQVKFSTHSFDASSEKFPW